MKKCIAVLVDCTVGESENTIYFYDLAKANTAKKWRHFWQQLTTAKSEIDKPFPAGR